MLVMVPAARSAPVRLQTLLLIVQTALALMLGTAHFPWIVMGLSSALFDPLLLRTVPVLPPQQTVPPALRKLRQAALVQQTRLLPVLRRVLAQMLPVTAQIRARKLETP